MDYFKLAEIYTNKKLTDLNVMFEEDIYGDVKIILWNVEGIQEPTIEQLESLQAQLDIKENNNLILEKINDLESSQARSLREMIVSPNDFARNKLIEINNQIQELRTLQIH